MRFELISLNYQVPKCDMRLERLPVVIGCSPEAGICLDEPYVSMLHCRIEEADNGQLIVHDLDSVHGTFVNGEPARGIPLKDGDELAIGMLTFFVQALSSDESLASWETVSAKTEPSLVQA